MDKEADGEEKNLTIHNYGYNTHRHTPIDIHIHKHTHTHTHTHTHKLIMHAFYLQYVVLLFINTELCIITTIDGRGKKKKKPLNI